jgi:heparinase II/III-like protein
MRLQRLLRMNMTEFTERSRQEISKRLERMGMIGKMNGAPHALAGKLAPVPAFACVDALIRERNLAGAGSLLLDRFRETAPDRFFAGIAREWPLSFVSDRLPSIRDDATAVAEAACRGRFDLLGYRGLSFGDPADWHLDPVSAHRAPLVHWSRLNPLDLDVVGDSKVVWELNRHQSLVRLGQAYWLTAEERYAERFVTTIQEWMRANPPGIGINWASSLEAALRLISWCWALFLFRGSKALSPEFFLDLLGGIWAHATHIERYLSYYFAPNTHLTGEALGLFYAGVVFPELREAGHWRWLGAQILIEQSGRQVFPDGVYFEQSTCYQRYTVEIYSHFLMLAARNDVPVPASVAERVRWMLDFLLTLRHGNGSTPQIGDSDGGCLLPLASRAPDDYRGVFSTAAAFFDRTDYAWAAGALAPETMWLLGTQGAKAFKDLLPAPPPTPPSRLFPNGGYAVMRSGWEDRAHQLIFDVGPLGSPVCAGHGHADLLSIQCAVFGMPYLVDPGTFCYSADPGWRDFFRSTAAHSTVTVDGAEQAEPDGLFAWKERPRVRVRRWLSTEAFDLADAEHDAYLDRPDPVTHRRRILFIKPFGWIVIDDLGGTSFHHVELRYQFAPLPVTKDRSGWIRAQGTEHHGLLVRAFATVPLRADLREGALNPKQGWYSSDYGRREPAPVLVYSVRTRLPLRIVSFLVPIEPAAAPPPPVSPLIVEGPDGRPEFAGLVFGQRQERILITEQDLVYRQAGPRPEAPRD